MIKSNYFKKNTAINIILMIKDLMIYHLRLVTSQRCLLSPLQLSSVLEAVAGAFRQEKKIKGRKD